MNCHIVYIGKKKKKKKNVISSLSAKLVMVNKYVSQRDDP